MLLIIQTGDPVAEAQVFGTFADWFINGTGLAKDQVNLVDVHKGETLPSFNRKDWSAVVVTGSASMVTEQLSWMKQTQAWLTHAFAHDLPTLGVCFGHQLIADLLGGQVDYNPLGRNMGLSQFELNSAGKQDYLLGHLSSSGGFNTLASHQQCVTELPSDVSLLGSCVMDTNHAFRYKDHVWGVQFHPEWSPQIMAAYLEARESELTHEGFSPVSMIDQLKACQEAESILKRFVAFAVQHKSH